MVTNWNLLSNTTLLQMLVLHLSQNFAPILDKIIRLNFIFFLYEDLILIKGLLITGQDAGWYYW